MIGDCNVGGMLLSRRRQCATISVCQYDLVGFLNLNLFGLLMECFIYSNSSVMSKPVVIIILTDHLNLIPCPSYS